MKRISVAAVVLGTLLVASAAMAQTPSSVVTPSTVTESVRSTTDALSGSARESLRESDKTVTDRAGKKMEDKVRTPAPVETRPLDSKR